MAAHPGLLKSSKTPTHNTTTNSSNSTNNSGYTKDNVVTSKYPISEKEAAEIAAKTEINVAAMKVIFPNYWSGFLEACLLVSATHTHTLTYIPTHGQTDRHTTCIHTLCPNHRDRNAH